MTATPYSCTAHFAKWRSLLFVPANNEKFIAAAACRGADAVILDLEDSVPSDLKASARQVLPHHIATLSAQGVDIVVRINYDMINAVADLAAAVKKETAAILVPKVLGADHLRLLDDAISLLETQRDIPVGSIKLIALIETIVGMESAAAIAQASPRLVGLALGTEDLSLNGGFEPMPENLMLPAQKIIYAARMANINAYGFPASIADYSDSEKCIQYQQRAKSMGFNGALCIHPIQVNAVNTVYRVSDLERRQAERIIAAYDAAITNNSGAVEVDGKMIDAPVVERAKKIIALADL